MDDETGQRLILVGMMGSGKTSVGTRLARLTGWPYFDNDDLLVEATGRTAADLAANGERQLRAAESSALAVGLDKPEPCIVAAAAGTILSSANRQAMRANGLVIWLRARPETLARRVQGSTDRPWIEGDAQRWMRQTVRSREPLYADLADATVHVDEVSPDKIAARILAQPAVMTLTKRRLRSS